MYVSQPSASSYLPRHPFFKRAAPALESIHAVASAARAASFSQATLKLRARMASRRHGPEIVFRAVEPPGQFGTIASGVFTPVLAKHSKDFSLLDCISVGVDRMQRNFETGFCVVPISCLSTVSLSPAKPAADDGG
jgi:hypothetical protein